MANTRSTKRPPVFTIVACLLCSITIGFICFNSTLKSDAEGTNWDWLFLGLYECLSVTAYLGSLYFLKRLLRFRGMEIIPVLFFVSVFGTTIPFLVSSIQIWYLYHLEFDWFIRHSLNLWIFLNVAMLVMMAVAAGVGFLFTYLNAKIAVERQGRETAGI